MGMLYRCGDWVGTVPNYRPIFNFHLSNLKRKNGHDFYHFWLLIHLNEGRSLMPTCYVLWRWKPLSAAIQYMYQKFRRKNPTTDLHEH